jgi:hypothetical protein
MCSGKPSWMVAPLLGGTISCARWASRPLAGQCGSMVSHPTTSQR